MGAQEVRSQQDHVH
ncbi:hypothetical protein LINGRAHAP2_LOCUS3412 [Linum grandiflorum]